MAAIPKMFFLHQRTLRAVFNAFLDRDLDTRSSEGQIPILGIILETAHMLIVKQLTG